MLSSKKNYGGNDGGNDINDSILHLLKNNNQISINEIAALLNISKRKCERVIAELKRIGKVKRMNWFTKKRILGRDVKKHFYL